jgi:hypothetical protein
MCHSPNSTELIATARQTDHSRMADPSNTPRKANSSGTAMSSNSETTSS